MKLTILGNNGPYPEAGGACSGYLIEHNQTRLLLDCGNGVLSNLFKYIDIPELDAIILTHLHNDHMGDILVLKYAVMLKRANGTLDAPISVFAPSSPEKEYDRLNSSQEFNLKEINEDLLLNIKDIKINFCEMTHPYKCFAVRIEAENKILIYSGDTSMNDKIIPFSKGANLLMLDAGFLSCQKPDKNPPHLTCCECGLIAKEAHVNKLLLTHKNPNNTKEQMEEEAKKVFKNTTCTGIFNEYII